MAQLLRRLGITGRTAVIAVPWVWLLLFFLIPFIIVLKISFADTRLGVPPYTPLLEWGQDGYVNFKMNVANYLFILKESLYLEAFLSSLKVAAVSTLFCLLIGYPMAYGIARSSDEYVRIAQRLASDPRALALTRRSLRQRLQASPLLDHRGVTRELEAAYRGMWRRWCASAEQSGAFEPPRRQGRQKPEDEI